MTGTEHSKESNRFSGTKGTKKAYCACPCVWLKWFEKWTREHAYSYLILIAEARYAAQAISIDTSTMST